MPTYLERDDGSQMPVSTELEKQQRLEIAKLKEQVGVIVEGRDAAVADLYMIAKLARGGVGHVSTPEGSAALAATRAERDAVLNDSYCRHVFVDEPGCGKCAWCRVNKEREGCSCWQDSDGDNHVCPPCELAGTDREAKCWHCFDVVLAPHRVRCERCPDECDVEGCEEPGCKGGGDA
jgi:hypothetical protein